jgi:hypothetical protein
LKDQYRTPGAVLAALANGIIPADARDGGAASVDAGARLAGRMDLGVNQALYVQGIATARAAAQRKFGRGVSELSAQEIDELLDVLRDEAPTFFKQLRMDVSALYLSDPAVWQRIGFPGPSIASGGYADFDQPQTRAVHELKEPTRMNIPNPLPAVQTFVSKPAKMLIGSEWHEAASGGWIDAIDPATGKTFGKISGGR